MECNRDEATRAKEIAELKFAEQKFSAAKKLVVKAQQLFPGLEGLSQMLPVIEIHEVAQCKVGGNEMDWYGILQVDCGADDGTIKKQYRRLALLLHPDKNKAVGAEAAFKLVGEAFGILSDKSKRQLHDMRRNVKTKPVTVRVTVEPNTQSYHPPPPTAPPAAATNPLANANNAFWTSCPRCKMQYQYLRTYENYQLQCQKCKEVFIARDIHSSTANGKNTWAPFPDGGHRDFGTFNKTMGGGTTFNGGAAVAGGNGFNMKGATVGSFPRAFPNNASGNASGFFSQAATAAAARSKVAAATAAAKSSDVPANNLAADVVHQTFNKVKRDRVEAEKEVKRQEREMRKKEKEEQKRARDAEKIAKDREKAKEAMDRLMQKRKENFFRTQSQRKGEARTGRKLKRKRRKGSDVEEEDEPAEEDPGLQDDISSHQAGTRRSARTKTNVATYKVADSEDDSDFQDFPTSKRHKSDGEGDKSESGKTPVHSENGGSADEKCGSGINGEMKDSDVGTKNVDHHAAVFVESSKRSEGVGNDTKVFDSSCKRNSRLRPGKAEKDSDCSGDEGESRGGKASSKSARNRRFRASSPDGNESEWSPSEQGPEGKETGFEEPGGLSPTLSAALQSSEKEDEDEEYEEHIEVPDPDFHNFDSARTESDIVSGQIWAIYDDQDGMPRFYGRISRVSRLPFKVHMQWLEMSPSEEILPWEPSSNISVACGEFRLGKSTVIDQINIFSHVVIPKASKGLQRIYPRKQEVWAIFTDCDMSQERSGPQRIKKPQGEGFTYSYDLVEILNDFSEQTGVKAVKLAKYGGYKTLFQRVEDEEAIRVYQPSELVTFSHSVPVERVAVDVALAHQIPQVGILELDPASTPLEILNTSR